MITIRFWISKIRVACEAVLFRNASLFAVAVKM